MTAQKVGQRVAERKPFVPCPVVGRGEIGENAEPVRAAVLGFSELLL